MTQKISDRIAARIAELESMSLADNATAEQRTLYSARVDRLSVLIGGLRNLAAVQASESMESDGVSPLDPRLIMVHLAGHAGAGVDANGLVSIYRSYEQALKLIGQQPAATPVPTAAPRNLTDEEATVLLSLMRDELVRYGVEPTVLNVQRTWRDYWRREGRRWGPSTPGWGPQENAPDRPAVLTPWP